MNSFSSERLYKLLPAIYQLRDTAEGKPLQTLLALIEQELLTIEGDISDLYDNWFIETCAEWAVPYIGDLLDVQEFYVDRPQTYGQQERRAYVANTISYRRRKGTAPVLEQLTQDVTGWRARAVEFARLVATTQNLNHIRPNSTTVNLRANNQLQQIGTPFEQKTAYTVDIRPVSQGSRYGLANIGLFIYRLQSYPIKRGTARAVSGSEPKVTGRCYTFNPLGKDVPLFNLPHTKTDILTLTEEVNLPGNLRRVPLANELKQRRQSRLQGKSLEGIRYFDDDPVLQIFVNGQPRPIPPEEILICSLESEEKKKFWNIPTQEFEHNDDDPPLPAKVVAVDPELGRIAFLNEPWPKRVEVSYFYGFSDDIGGGSYNRNNANKNHQESKPLFWEIKQIISTDTNPLATAITTWNKTVEVWQGFKKFTHIPLARIVIPINQVNELDSEETRPRFKPGIIDGLRVVRSGVSSLIITPGHAVDRQGRLIILEKNYVVNLEKFNLNQDVKGSLVIFYRPPSEKQTSEPGEVAIEFVSENAFDEYPPGTFIPLINLELNSRQLKPQFDESRCRYVQFQRGILQGLEVKLQPGKLEAVIAAGTVVDERGRSLIIPNNLSIDLSPYQGETKYLVLRKTEWKKQWQVELLNKQNFKNDDPNSFYLTGLAIPKVHQLQLEEVDKGKIEIKGLKVTVDPERPIIAISPGIVRNEQGKTINLEREIQFDLSAYSGQILTLFISFQTKQGLPLSPINPKGRRWQHLGIVPQQPEKAETGTILIADNCTYEGDLSIIAPAQRRLQIIAADGCRPHILGNLSVRGTAIAKCEELGELTLNGLLVEGKVTVLAGNLKQLNIYHCTIVPQQGGLSVQPGWLVPLDFKIGEGFDAIALVKNSLNWMWQSMRRDVGLSNASPEFNSNQLLQPAVQQLQNRVSQIWQVLQRWRCPQELETYTKVAATTTQWDNACLEIVIDRSICGPICINDTVPKLTITNSIIDKGLTEWEQQSEAISALGSEVEIKTTTVFGITTVRNLEASNSIFTEKVIVLRHQKGCIRFSYVPEASHTPRRYKCQPDMALKAALKRVPTAVTAIQILPQPDTKNYFVFLGTAGDGVFRLTSQKDEPQWEEVTLNSSSRHITALLAYTQPGIGKISSRDKTVTGVASKNQSTNEVSTVFTKQLQFGDIIITANQRYKISEIVNNSKLKLESSLQTNFSNRIYQINTLWVGTLDGSIYCSRNNGESWINIETKVNTAINHLAAWVRQGTGTISNDNRKLVGNETFFSSEMREGDTITIGEETRIVTALGEAGIGTISSQGITVTGEHTKFKETLQIGDKITALNQTRIIVKIYATNLEADKLEINAPFPENLPKGTPFKIKVDTILQVNTAFDNDFKDLPFEIRHLLAATLGDGIILANDRGTNWEKINTGLTNLNITALVINSRGALFAGTMGGGVFQFTSHETNSGKKVPHWIQFNTGLSNLHITSLAIDAKGNLWAGTAGSGIFCSTLDGKGWTEINDGLTSFMITAITTVITRNFVFAGTANGQIFRLLYEDNKWQQIKSDSQGIDITTLIATIADENNQDVLALAGTASGDILQSIDGGKSWVSINQGLPSVAEKMLIMERLRPNFTSMIYGNPSYAQLSQDSPKKICTGAEDGAEMGVFNFLKQPQREANLRASIEENLRFGLKAGFFYIS